MKNFIQDGKVLDIVLAAAIVSGAGLLIGTLLGIASKSGAIGDTIAFNTEGVFDIAYGVAATVAVGDKLYWDDTAKGLTKTASGNTKVGICVKAAGSSDPTVRCRLVPSI